MTDLKDVPAEALTDAVIVYTEAIAELQVSMEFTVGYPDFYARRIANKRALLAEIEAEIERRKNDHS